MRTLIERSGRPGAALLLCGAVLIVPLFIIQTGSSGAISGTARSHAQPAPVTSAAVERHGAYLPAWQLAVDHIASTAGEPTGAIVSPTVTPSTSVPSAAQSVASSAYATTTTTLPPRRWTTPTTAPAYAPAATSTQTYSASGAYSRRGVVSYYDATPGTCASPTLSFGTVVTVTNPDNGKSVKCKVDDRMANTERQIDLATATFAQIAPLPQGVISNAELSW